MGLFGDILGGIANAALDGIKENIKDSLGLNDSVGILFEHDNIPFHDVEIRNSLMDGILQVSAKFLEVSVGRNDLGTTWQVKFDDGCADTFIVTNGNVVISYGLYAMANCAILIEDLSGQSCSELAKSIAAYLEQLDFDNIRFYQGEIPFHEKAWINMTKRQLVNSFQTSIAEKENEDDISILEGTAENATKLLKKWDEIFLRDFEDIFDEDSVSYSVDSENNIPIISDETTTVTFNFAKDFLDSEEGFVFCSYQKSDKTLLFAFIVTDDDVKLNLVLTKNDGVLSQFCAKSKYEDYTLEDLLTDLEDEDVEIPDDLSEHLKDFLEMLADSFKENYKSETTIDDTELDDL